MSAEFSKELTTSVIWLNECGLDIECVRIKPYSDNGRILADIQQIIPLPEAEDYRGGKAFDGRRNFCSEGELIIHEGKTYAFTNQWGHRTLKAIDQLIEAFPSEAISYRVTK